MHAGHYSITTEHRLLNLLEITLIGFTIECARLNSQLIEFVLRVIQTLKNPTLSRVSITLLTVDIRKRDSFDFDFCLLRFRLLLKHYLS